MKDSYAIRLLHLDDEGSFRAVMQRELARKGHQVVGVGSVAEAMESLKANEYDVVLLDLRLNGEDGMTALRAILDLDPHPEVVMLTGHGTIDAAIQAMRLGAFHFLMKPCDMVELEVTVRKAYEHSQLSRENVALRTIVTRGKPEARLIGSSPRMRELIRTAEAVAASEASVLIEGESGTGKELLAHLIHTKSPRAAQPFIPVNCAAFHEQLLASELFGHERGAFTGATSRKVGLFEAADGGTLFLDEIGDMALPVQATLLRALESGEIRPLGSTRSKRVKVRIVSATNKNLRERLNSGFREDLFYRLNTVELHALPLREHIEDIPELVQAMLRQIPAAQHVSEITPEVYDALACYHWPGNVRELKGVLERAAILCPGPVLGPANLPDLGVPRAQGGKQYAVQVPLSLQQLERLHIEHMLAHFAGNKSLTAKALGVTRKTLYSKLADYGITD